MKNEHLQVKRFDNVTGDSESQVNQFLKEVGGRVEDIHSHYNTILGGIEYIVIYTCA